MLEKSSQTKNVDLGRLKAAITPTVHSAPNSFIEECPAARRPQRTSPLPVRTSMRESHVRNTHWERGFPQTPSLTENTYVNSVDTAELLGIDPALVIEPPRYDIGREPCAPPLPRAQRVRAAPLDRRKVARFYPAALAGVPDADIARAAGVTVSQVRGWRMRLGIKRRPGAARLGRLGGALLSVPDLASAFRAYDQERDAVEARTGVPHEDLDAFFSGSAGRGER